MEIEKSIIVIDDDHDDDDEPATNATGNTNCSKAKYSQTVKSGKILLQQKSYTKAIEAFSMVLSKYPNNIECLRSVRNSQTFGNLIFVVFEINI